MKKKTIVEINALLSKSRKPVLKDWQKAFLGSLLILAAVGTVPIFLHKR